MIKIDERMLEGPLIFSCYYDSLEDKHELYSWLTENFGGEIPSLEYYPGGTKNDNWFVSDSFMHQNRISGGVKVKIKDEVDATAFKLRWL